MKKLVKTAILLTALLCSAGAFAAILPARDTSAIKVPVEQKKIYRMGEIYGTDSSKASGRSFPKRLVMPKGAVGVGLQFLWLKMGASDFQALALVSGVNGSVSFGNVAPAVLWAYTDNNALGLRLGYTNVGLDAQSGTIRLFSDDLKFDIGGLNTKVNAYGASVFNRSWFGLDKQGRFALFADVDLGYTYTDTRNSASKAGSHSISLGFSPGLEIFVLNGLSMYFSLSFANISYNMSTCYGWTADETASGGGYWTATGSSNAFKAQARLNLLDLRFGLAYYF